MNWSTLMLILGLVWLLARRLLSIFRNQRQVRADHGSIAIGGKNTGNITINNATNLVSDKKFSFLNILDLVAAFASIMGLALTLLQYYAN